MTSPVLERYHALIMNFEAQTVWTATAAKGREKQPQERGAVV